MTQNTDKAKSSSEELYQRRQLDAIADRWNAKAEHWDRELQDPCCHLNEDHSYSYFLDRLSQIIAERAGFCSGNGAVDDGCATGLVLAHVMPFFAWGIGIDISPEMIRIARAKNIPNAHFIVGDCFELPGPYPKAGAVISRGVLLSHYGPTNALDLLRSAQATLTSGGFIFCDFLNKTGRAKSRHSPANKAYYEPRAVCELATRAGFVNARSVAEPHRRVGLMLAERA